MDFIIYGFILLFILTLLIIGFVKKQNLLVVFSGIGFMLLGIALVGGLVQFKSGDVTNYAYVCGCCENNTFNTGQALTGSCSGIEPTCDTYDGNQATCTSIGCTYNNSLCSGNPTPCETYTSSSQCARYGFCEWSYTYSSCTNGSVSVIANLTKTNVYKTYSDDTIGGISLNYVFGFFMVLTGLFFILVAAIDFLNLKKQREPAEVIDEE